MDLVPILSTDVLPYVKYFIFWRWRGGGCSFLELYLGWVLYYYYSFVFWYYFFLYYNKLQKNIHFYIISKALALWADAFYKSRYLCVFVFVCVFTFWCTVSTFEAMSNGKKWSQMWTFLLKKCQKLLRWKKFYFGFFFPLFTPFKRLFVPTSRSSMSQLN